ncbi:MAG TPA: hypothetical protein DCZ95_09305 [Verrucomicrobia bacterium]|nr:MAG: hypothetical protein A2X46_06425 [Lentisphaerae bacterium GWF2_57_35]HBA84275.1 hypothetical protein [Verrucomicrobiota bacterium]
MTTQASTRREFVKGPRPFLAAMAGKNARPPMKSFAPTQLFSCLPLLSLPQGAHSLPAMLRTALQADAERLLFFIRPAAKTKIVSHKDHIEHKEFREDLILCYVFFVILVANILFRCLCSLL